MAIELRPYQMEAIDRARLAARQGRKRICLVCPTGGGKTIIAARIMLSAYELGKRSIFFAHRRELIKQTVAKLIEAGIPCWQVGTLMGQETSRAWSTKPVIVASVATWVRREVPDADLVFIDEAHHATSNSYAKVLERYKGSVFVGLTATPYRANGDGLGDCFDSLELVTTPADLIDQGHLCKFRVFAGPERPDLDHVRTVAGEYDKAQVAEAVDKQRITHGIVANWKKLADQRRTICFATSVVHSRHIVEAFEEEGINAVHIDESTPKPDRDAAFARLASGDVQVLSNVGICTEGTDIPAAKCAILARPTKSVGLYLQMVGRILRPWQSQTALILDHADNVRRLGFPDADRAFTLEKKPKRESDVVMAKHCPECESMVPIQQRWCPECGYTWPPSESPDLIDPRKKGELVELQRHEERCADKNGPCSDRQAAVLRRAGLRTDVTMAQAGWIIGQMVSNRWKVPPAIAVKFGVVR